MSPDLLEDRLIRDEAPAPVLPVTQRPVLMREPPALALALAPAAETPAPSSGTPYPSCSTCPRAAAVVVAPTSAPLASVVRATAPTPAAAPAPTTAIAPVWWILGILVVLALLSEKS
jgi:hypothetical protein